MDTMRPGDYETTLGGIDQGRNRLKRIQIGLAEEGGFGNPHQFNRDYADQPQWLGRENRHRMAYSRQILVRVMVMLLVVRTSTVMHRHKINESQIGFLLPMLLIMLKHFGPLGRLVQAEYGEHTASQ